MSHLVPKISNHPGKNPTFRSQNTVIRQVVFKGWSSHLFLTEDWLRHFTHKIKSLPEDTLNTEWWHVRLSEDVPLSALLKDTIICTYWGWKIDWIVIHFQLSLYSEWWWLSVAVFNTFLSSAFTVNYNEELSFLLQSQCRPVMLSFNPQWKEAWRVYSKHIITITGCTVIVRPLP